ncbi:MAG: tRNA lysidine(34) synthetase TilS, partial [Clostridia bacterium]|nr:tRNA lysidine(34) synthetase TilS [Clostridia bacterium]
MENIKRLILQNKLINPTETIGVGVSGGKDSMALLHKLNELSKELNFEVVAITVDHSIRENAKADAQFVVDYCHNNKIRVYKFKIDAPLIAKQKRVSVESAAREGRFGVFETLIQKGICSKIAIAHHQSDQVETVLMHLLRGSGVGGLKGMSLIRDNIFIRPMLETHEGSIWNYIQENDIPFVVDETNQENEYNRNYIRNQILPLILDRWPNAIENILNFSNLAAKDDEYINSQVPTDAFIVTDKEVKVPLSYFVYATPVVSRMIYKALHIIGVNKDIESKHIDMIIEFAKNSQNGKKINLPLKVSVH